MVFLLIHDIEIISTPIFHINISSLMSKHQEMKNIAQILIEADGRPEVPLPQCLNWYSPSRIVNVCVALMNQRMAVMSSMRALDVLAHNI